MLHMKFDFDWPSGLWGEDVENVDNIHTYIQRHTYPISSTLSLRLRWAKTCLFLFVETSGFCILKFFTTKLVQIKYIQNIQFSISIRTLVDVLLFNNIFETNKIEQINCPRSFQTSAYNAFCFCTLEKMRSQIWWMDEFGVLRPFQQFCFVFHISVPIILVI